MTAPARSPLAILLGASTWPNYPDLNRQAFRHSAREFKEFLTSELHLPEENIRDLFDSPLHAPELLEDIRTFLGSHEESKPPVLLLYYVGHGQVIDDRYYLMVATTCQELSKGTSLSLDVLDQALKGFGKSVPQIFILDACHAASAVDVFTRPRSGKGVSVLAAASRDDYAVAPDETASTAFTKALLASLKAGDASYFEWLSLADVRDMTEGYLLEEGVMIRPEIHDPEQRQGRVSELRLFPNRAHRPTAAAPIPTVPTRPWCVVLSSADHKSSLLRDAVGEMAIKYAQDIDDEFGWRLDGEPALFETDKVATSDRSFLAAVRRVCRAQVAVIDLTGFEPAAVLVLGIRSVVRRGVTVCVTAAPDWDELAPFHLREVRLTPLAPLSATGEAPWDILARRVIAGLRELQNSPRSYLDLPSFEAVRALPSDPDSARTRTIEHGKVLVLCPFSSEYTSKNWAQLRQRLDTRVRPLIRQDSENQPRVGPEIARSLDIDSPRIISGALYEAIRLTEFCIVDLTEWRPNVLFEFGVRLAASPTLPVVIWAAEEHALGEAPSDHGQRNSIAARFDPIRYGLANMPAATDEMIERYQALRVAGARSTTHHPLAEANLIFPEAWRFVDDTTEPVTPGTVERLREIAQSMLTDKTAGARPTIYPPRHFLSDVAESNGIELLAAAWLYLVHRLGAERMREDEQVRKVAISVGSELIDRLGSPANHGDKKFADEVFDLWDELRQLEKSKE